jgi:D-alanyl-D-alanine carboxypeptidase (penicillin-binding protein 5/6)
MRILSAIKVITTAACLSTCLFSQAYSFDTKARAAYVIDHTSGTILLSKNSDLPLPPASMSKLMTLYMTFEFIKAGRLSLDEKLPVSKNAAKYTGSTMFLNPTDRVTVLDLIRGIIVLSGNDACAVIAEALSPDGTEAGFAKLMTQRGKQIGLENSTFKNSNGWPADDHKMSVRDLGILAEKLFTDFPEYYPMFAEQTYEFDGRAPANTRNRNPLLGLGIGADGLKTGHTKEAGYGLVGSAKQDGRRIVFVLSGLNTLEDRAQEAETIVNWAFRQFMMEKFATGGSEIGKAKVWNGKSRDVTLVLEKRPKCNDTCFVFERT